MYASEKSDARHPNGIKTAETMVDLATKKILFTEDGIDAYWSIDGTRIIYSGGPSVSIRDTRSGAIARGVAPPGLGDYYSWARRDGKDLILTIASNYYYLDGDKAVLPISKVKACDKIGTGERPLISKDGKRITTFVDGNIVVRGLDNCDDIFDTGIKGAKADFSWDGRYIAFHSLKPQGSGYNIQIVDLQQHTIRTLPGLSGSALFPSWTKDGRLCFRYDGPDYRGFMMASNVLDVPAQPLPAVAEPLPHRRTWEDVFQTAARPGHRVNVVMIWAPWSAHSQEAFTNLDRARDYFAGADVSIAAAADPGSAESEITRQWIGVPDERCRACRCPRRAWRSPRRETRCRRRFSSATDCSSTRSSALRASSSCEPGSRAWMPPARTGRRRCRGRRLGDPRRRVAKTR